MTEPNKPADPILEKLEAMQKIIGELSDGIDVLLEKYEDIAQGITDIREDGLKIAKYLKETIERA